MNANVPLELVAEKIGECVDFVRINLQQGTLLVDGIPIGYAYKKKEENKNYSYMVDPEKINTNTDTENKKLN